MSFFMIAAAAAHCRKYCIDYGVSFGVKYKTSLLVLGNF